MTTMRTNKISNIKTLFNQYEDGVKEFVFSVKKRPFGMVISASLQYQKLMDCRKKMRILGKVSMTVQCIQDGAVSDNVRVRAFVVMDCHTNLDVDSIAGEKMLAKLQTPTAITETMCDTIKKEEWKLFQQLPDDDKRLPFGNADVKIDPEEQIHVLLDVDA